MTEGEGGRGRGRGWRRIFQASPRSEVDEELEFHLEARSREYMAQGLTPEAAREAARARMGDLEGARGECAALLAANRRTEARRQWMMVSWLDFKLGFRMLVKYPGLTVVGGLAMAFALWVGAGTFEFVRQVVHPALPLDDGGRVVGILVMDAEAGGLERRLAADFVRWRGGLETIDHLGAFRTLERNLVTGDGTGVGEPVEVAEMTASGFEVARVAPELGRTLVPDDEAPGAPPVVVLGHEVWERRFGADPGIVGTQVRLGATPATVVGVMPAGFAFPVSQSLWMPLRRDALEHEPREGPGLFIFGRLVPGARLAEAESELTTLGQRAAAAFPETHEHLRPRVLPYARSILYLPGPAVLGLGSVNLFILVLIVLISGNVALLMFARAATREGELLVRNALGASRGRIVGQLFVEALVLGTAAATLGLAAAGFGLRWMYGTLIAEVGGTNLPFWFSPSLSTGTVVYSLFLTLAAAAVAGVVPALKVTRPDVEARLRQVGAGGGGPRFGGIWTAVIVAQIAITVLFPLFGYMVFQDTRKIRTMEVNFPEEQYLSVRLELDRDAPAAGPLRTLSDELAGTRDTADDDGDAFAARYRAAAAELVERMESRPGVLGVTFADRLPRMYHPHRLIEIDEGGAAPMRPEWPGYRVSNVSVAVDYFDELQVDIIAGRDFHSGDLAPNARSVVVNESFVQLVLGGRNPLGRHLRYMYRENEGEADPESEPWYEIVGVVPDMGLAWSSFDTKAAGIYHPVPAGGVYPAHLAIHASGGTREIGQELRAVATAVDPALRLYDVIPLDEVDASELRFYSFWFWLLVLVSGVAITLSLAGIYAVMSFAVARRTREIGIRVALGASRRRVLAAVFRRPLIQIGLGLGAGAVLIVAIAELSGGDILSPRQLAFLAAYMTTMTAICLTACVIPTRRALGVEPSDALRADG